jgi:hypothetical protein
VITAPALRGGASVAPRRRCAAALPFDSERAHGLRHCGRDGPASPSGGPMALIETDEAARRLARAIASDLSLYNEEKVVEGITNDSLYEVMAEELEEGRALFQSRVTPELYAKNFYDRAVIDILVRSKAHIDSKMW